MGSTDIKGWLEGCTSSGDALKELARRCMEVDGRPEQVRHVLQVLTSSAWLMVSRRDRVELTFAIPSPGSVPMLEQPESFAAYLTGLMAGGVFLNETGRQALAPDGRASVVVTPRSVTVNEAQVWPPYALGPSG